MPPSPRAHVRRPPPGFGSALGMEFSSAPQPRTCTPPLQRPYFSCPHNSITLKGIDFSMQQDQLADMLTTLIGMHKNEVYAIQTFSEDKASCARTVGVHFYDPEVAGKLLKFFSQPSSLLDQRCKALLPARSAASNTTRSGHPTVDASYGGTVVTSAVVEGGGFCRAAARNAVRLPSCVLHACMVVEWEDAGMMEVLVEDVKRTGGGAHWQSLFDPVTGAHEGYSLTAHYITPDCAYCAQLELNGKVLGYMRHNNLPAVSFTFSPTSEQETPPEPSTPVPLAPAPPVPAPSYEQAFSHSAHAGDGVVHVHVVRMHGEAAAGVVMAEGNKG